MRNLKELFMNDETPATILNSAIVQMYGGVVYVYEPETIWLEIMDDLKINDLSRFIKDKIMAIIVLNTSGQFYDAWEPFEKIGKALNHQLVHFEDMTPLEPEELAWTILESRLNHKDASLSTFGFDVMAYIKTVLKSNGVSVAPPFIAKYIDYNTENDFDKKIELQYQSRISLYCIKELNKIIDLSMEFFNKEIRQSLGVELPEVKAYISGETGTGG